MDYVCNLPCSIAPNCIVSFITLCVVWCCCCYHRIPANKKKVKKLRKVANAVKEIKKEENVIGNILKGGAKFALTEGGGMLGSMFGPAGSAFGRKAGAWLSKITGMGDYKVEANTLFNGQVPSFNPTNHSNRVMHREFLGNVLSSTSFVCNDFTINPGLFQTFPWLCNMARLYTQYTIKGLIFEFKSTSADALNSTNTALGTVILATRYNSYDPPFTSKVEAMNHEYTTSSKPSEDCIHPIECKPDETPYNVHFVRSNDVGPNQDIRLYDWGKTSFCTEGMQEANVVIGELWVSYDIVFTKPRLNPSAYPNPLHGRISNGPYDTDNLLGTIQRGTGGNMELTVTATGSGFETLNFPAFIAAGRFMVVHHFLGTDPPTVWNYTNAHIATDVGWGFNLDTGTYQINAFESNVLVVVDIVDVDEQGVKIVYSNTGVTNTGASRVDVIITQMPAPNDFQLVLDSLTLLAMAEEQKENIDDDEDYLEALRRTSNFDRAKISNRKIWNPRHYLR
jgi:hypothetical protein